ncbi:MAG TPA: triose-phosphate isomerase [Candidatus Nanoarchaeia archaeon]|nr:triose-phosphate isomerase [Candidatus Nanoarchaeia archaeon]
MKLVVANWKMNKTLEESVDFIERIKKIKTPSIIVVCPPFTSLKAVSDAVKGSKILLGAQNMHHEDFGAYTGEISPLMLKDAGCKYVILGHSERRKYFCETDEMISLKVKSAQSHGLIPIVCVGESLSERRNGKTLKVINSQLSKCLKGTNSNLIIAYEPVWAIGTGNNATPQQASEVHSYIKAKLRKKFKKEIKVLYGGSVSPSTIKGFLSEKSIDGVLVGTASLDPRTFAKLL